MEEFVVMKSFKSLIVEPGNDDTELCSNNNNNNKKNEMDDLPNIVQNLHVLTFFWDMTQHQWVIRPKHFKCAMSFGTSETNWSVLWRCIPKVGSHQAHFHESITLPTMLPQIIAHSSMTKDYYANLLNRSDIIKTLTYLSHISLFSHLFCLPNDVY